MPAKQFKNLMARGSASYQSTELYPQILLRSSKNLVSDSAPTPRR
jgi:hypothetical protein